MKEIVLHSECLVDENTRFVSENYDLAFNGESEIRIPSFDYDELSKFPWNIGCIVGDSGSGKSTVLNDIGSVYHPSFDNNKSVVSQLDGDPSSNVALLQAVGLSSIPTYFQTPNKISLGQRARLELAMAISKTEGEVVLIDEFTSVVNRACAKSMSYCVQKYIRKHNKKMIVASCHFDIIDWLRPDWVYNLNSASNGIERIVYDGYEGYEEIDNKSLLSREVAI